jgi:hypothetical protein
MTGAGRGVAYKSWIPGVIEQAMNFFNANLFSENMKRLVANETACTHMHIVKLRVGGFLVG